MNFTSDIRIVRRYVYALVVVTLVILPSGIALGGWRVFCPAPVCGCECSTIYKAGTGGQDLQVHVVGKSFDTIEAYFREEYHRETLPLKNLHCGRILLAPKNPYGTFVVQLGACGDSIKAYGWKNGQFAPTTTQ